MRPNLLKLIFILLLVAGIYSLIEPYWIEEKHNLVTSTSIPGEFHNFKLVFVSDIHHGPFFSQARVEKLVTTINNLNPDLIVLGGDYVDQDQKYIKPCFNELKRLSAKYGVYAVLGNHDHRESKNETLESMHQAHIYSIDNNAFWITKGAAKIKLGGVGDYMEDNQDIKPAIVDLSKADYFILVSHNPDYIEELNLHKYKDLVDLVLCGHMHGGQVTFFGLYAPLLPSSYGQKYRTGQKRINDLDIIISNGIGAIAPPIRFFARPQINIIEFKKTD